MWEGISLVDIIMLLDSSWFFKDNLWVSHCLSETETSAKQEGDESKTEETKNEDEDDITKDRGGVKRKLEDEEEEKKTEKVDPSKAPDPEEPEKFDESALKSDLEEQFNPPEDDVTITLDRCEWERREEDRDMVWKFRLVRNLSVCNCLHGEHFPAEFVTKWQLW